MPLFVCGDGVSTIQELIDTQNQCRLKNIHYKNILVNRIDSAIDKNKIPYKGEFIRLKRTTILENGAIFVDLSAVIKSKYDGLAEYINKHFDGIDYIELTCLSERIEGGWGDSSFIIRDISQSNANLTELFSCASNVKYINNYLNYFKPIKKELVKKNTLSKSKEFKNKYLKQSYQSSILREAAYRKGLKVDNLEPNRILLTNTHNGQKVYFDHGMSDRTPVFARTFTNDKALTKLLLQKFNISTPEGFKASINSIEDAWHKAQKFKGSIVVKPIEGSGGVGVSTYIKTRQEFNIAWEICKKLKAQNILVEECVTGSDYRVVVIDNKVCAVTQRVAAYVVGDGENDIEELINLKAIVRKSNPFYAVKRFQPNDIMIQYLNQKGLSLSYIPQKGENVRLIDAVNIGSGGESIDRTDEIHPDWIDVAVNTKKAVLDPFHIGFDLMAEDISKSPHHQNWSIIEVNLNPDLGLQVFPEVGMPLDIGGALLDNLFGDIKAQKIQLHFSVYGKVQQVGYRKWLKAICNLRSVNGYIANHVVDSERVDIVLYGMEATVNDVFKMCYQGPKNAKVSKINLLNSVEGFFPEDFFIK